MYRMYVYIIKRSIAVPSFWEHFCGKWISVALLPALDVLFFPIML